MKQALLKAEIVEQDGNFFKSDGKGGFDYMPKTVEQDGNIFDFDAKTADYKYVSPAPKVQSFVDAPLEAAKALGRAGLEGVAYVGEKVDRYTGAPTRAGIYAAQTGNSPLSAFAKQFGNPSAEAPTGKDIASKAGLSRAETISIPYLSEAFPNAIGKVSPAGIAGLIVDVLADPLNVIPGVEAAKLTAKGMKAGAKYSGKMAVKAGDAVTNSKGFSTAVRIGQESLDSLANPIQKLINPKVHDKYIDYVDTAVKNGIDPEFLSHAHKYGDDSFISRGSRQVREDVAGEPARLKFREGVRATSEAIDKKIGTISGGASRTAFDAGEAIRKGFDEGTQAVFDKTDLTFNTIAQQVPGLKINPGERVKLTNALKELEQFGEKRSSMGVLGTQREQANQILRAIGAVKSALGPKLKMTAGQIGDLKNELGRMSTSLGDVAGKSLDQDPTYRAMLKNISTDLNNINKSIPSSGSLGQKQIDAIQLTLKNTQDQLSGLGRKGLNAADNKQLSKLDQSLQIASDSTASFPDMVEAMRNIGEAAFKNKNVLGGDIPPDTKRLREIYFKVSDALTETVKKDLGDDIYNQLKENNKILSEFFDQKSYVYRDIENRTIGNDKLFKNLVVNGDTPKIEALLKILPPEYHKQLKGAFLESLASRKLDNTQPFWTMQKNLEKKGTTASLLLDPTEISELNELFDLGNKFGPINISSSGTSAGNVFSDIVNSFKNAVYNRGLIETMITRADDAYRAASNPSAPALLKAPIGTNPKLTPLQQLMQMRRGKYEMALKGAQVESTQMQNKRNEDAVLKRLRN